MDIKKAIQILEEHLDMKVVMSHARIKDIDDVDRAIYTLVETFIEYGYGKTICDKCGECKDSISGKPPHICNECKESWNKTIQTIKEVKLWIAQNAIKNLNTHLNILAK